MKVFIIISKWEKVEAENDILERGAKQAWWWDSKKEGERELERVLSDFCVVGSEV